MPLQPETAGLISRQLAELHRAAQERVGLSAALATFYAWAQMSPTAPVLTIELIAEILEIAHNLRDVSRRLAARYYNLSRAVGQGAGFPDIGGRFATGRVTLSDFYDALAESLNEVATSTNLDLNADLPAPDDTQSYGEDRTLDERLDDLEDALIEWFQETLPEEGLDDQVTIELPEEDWDWPSLDENDEDLLADLEEIEQEMQRTLEREKRVEVRNLERSLRRLGEQAETAAAKAAGKVDKDVLEAGRRVMRVVGGVDQGRYAWMRVTGPHPCGFCSMLASRGAVYDTAENAGYGNTYHDHCHCHQVPVFQRSPYYSERDKWFMDAWKSQIQNRYSGKAALRAWRTWLTSQYKLGLVPDQDVFGPAQAA